MELSPTKCDDLARERGTSVSVHALQERRREDSARSQLLTLTSMCVCVLMRMHCEI